MAERMVGLRATPKPPLERIAPPLTARVIKATAVLAGFVVSIFFTYLAVRGLDWAQFRSTIAHSNLWWLAPAFVVLMAGMTLRAVRWRLLFPPELRPPLPAVFRALLIGQFFNNVLPGRPGEALRVVTLYQETKTSRTVALGTAVSERLYDVIVLLVVFFVAVPWLPHVDWVRRAGILAGLLCAGLGALLAVLAIWDVKPILWALRPFSRLPGLAPENVERIATGLVVGLAAMRRARMALPALVVSFAAILVITLSYWLVTFAVGFHLSFGAAVLVMVATNLAMVIPSSPAAIGVFEAATVVALRTFGVPHADALGYGVILHALNSIPFIAIGLALLPRHGLKALRKTQAEAV